MTQDEQFEQFWNAFPNRVAKKAAQKSWSKAITLAEPNEIIAGVERYKSAKPSGQAWLHPATFLNGMRWEDEYAPEPMPKVSATAKMIEQRRQLDETNERLKYIKGQLPLSSGHKLLGERERLQLKRAALETALNSIT